MTLFEKIDCEIPVLLRPFVMAVVQGETSSAVQTSMPAPPTGFPLLIYVYGDYPKLNVNGKSFVSSTVPLNVAGQIDISGIRMQVDGVFGQIGLVLHPLAPYYLFHISGNEISNRWKGLLGSLPSRSKTYFDSISSDLTPKKNISNILRALQLVLEHRINPIEWLDFTIAEIFKHNGSISLSELINKTNMSERHFRRKFKEIVGISPKYFCKVIQLNSVFEIIKSANTDKLHALALDYGYYDQAHFINDFSKLIGESPVNFLNGAFVHLKSYLGRNKI
ncbi:MAG: helix-turn-helix domain-containing protein [Maribacter sp.]